MSLSSYFSDNQSKQKAYDRYYNQTARSDFVQRRKLRALIAQEAADESLTDKLAQLYMSSVGKAPDYEYDMVLKKIQKSKPEVVKGPTVAIPTPAYSATPETPATARRPRRSSVEYFKTDKATQQFIDSERVKEFKAKNFANAEKNARRAAQKYVDDYQKAARSDKFNANRAMNASEAKVAEEYIVSQVLGDKRSRSASDNAKPKTKRSAKRNIFDNRDNADYRTEGEKSDSDLSDEFKKSLKEEAEFKKLFKTMKKNIFTEIANFQPKTKSGNSNWDGKQLYEYLKKYQPAIDKARGDEYFKDNIKPPPKGKNTKEMYVAYKDELTGILQGIFT
ncbi:unnamed protein product [Phytophthora lilii]|uniref:Unnamed protein product n=1 Tax=Phytophthora lilii TaxID=2077276 RepID=A0A9W6YJN5_9STRA|nr:unnamed protein product [Phytophthora lilii]